MQDTAYADALRQSPVCVYGLWLQTYALRHEALLLAERNAFLTESPLGFKLLPLWKRIDALDRATSICSNFHRKRFSRVRGWFLQSSRKKYGAEDYAREAMSFFHYLNMSRCAPRLSRRRLAAGEQPGRTFGAPLLAQVHQFVMTLPEIQKISKPQAMLDAAWDYPFGLAIWRYFVQMESIGAVQIENEDEEKTRIETDKVKNEYNDTCAAWKNAKTDADRAAALKKFPKLREFAATEDEVRAFEAKGAPCPA